MEPTPLRQASVELQTLNHDSEKVSAAIDEMSEHANGPRLSLNGDVFQHPR
jgi:hypothetical protein